MSGVDITNHVIMFNLYESIYKPYITIHVELLDNTPGGVIKNIGPKPGDPLVFSFDVVEDNGLFSTKRWTYDGVVYLLGLKGETKNDSLRSVHYIVKGIGPSWMKDQKTIVQQPFQHISATRVMANIHNSYVGGDAGLRVLEESIGPVDKEVWWAQGIKPFLAIEKLKSRANYASVKTGSTMYYRDRDGYVIAPLEKMFKTMANQQTFVQKTTDGIYITDLETSKQTIVAIHSLVDENEMGRIGATRTASASSQAQGSFNLKSKENKYEAAKSFISSVGGILRGGGGQHGGKPNYGVFDSHKMKEQAPHQKARAENAYLAQFKNGVQFAVKVPINTGINVTVGDGVFLKLIPPQGDMSVPSVLGQDQSGLYMVTTLVHTMKFFSSITNGFTAFECAKGGGAE